MEDYAKNLETLKFKKDPAINIWRNTFEGISLSACLHPLKGIAISYYYMGNRTASQGEIFLPVNSTVQEIAESIIRIHNEVKNRL